MAVLTPHSLNRLLAYRCSVWRLVCAQSAGGHVAASNPLGGLPPAAAAAADDFVSPPPGLDEGGLDLPPFEEPPPFDDLPPSPDGLSPPGGGGGAGAYSVFTVFVWAWWGGGY